MLLLKLRNIHCKDMTSFECLLYLSKYCSHTCTFIYLLLNGIMWLHIVNINKAKGEIWILAVIDNSLNLMLVDAMIESIKVSFNLAVPAKSFCAYVHNCKCVIIIIYWRFVGFCLFKYVWKDEEYLSNVN